MKKGKFGVQLEIFIMEDIEKYVFDPEHPKKFKAYRLLKTLVNKNNSIVFMDPIFATLLFPHILFDQEIINQIWDNQENFNKLSVREKIEIYIKNYSAYEFHTLIIDKLTPHYLKHFHVFKGITTFDYDWYYNILENGFEKDNIDKEIYHHISFLTKDYFHILNRKTLVTGVVFVFESEFNYLKKDIFKNNIRPIIIKEVNHLFLLFQELKRDLDKQKKLKNKSTLSSSFLLESKIKNYFSLCNISLHYKKQKEIYFIGENGDGKTLLLQAILLGIIGNQEIGVISDFLKQDNNSKKLQLKAIDNKGNSYQYLEGSNLKEKHGNVFAYGVNRFQNDSDKKDQHGFLTLFSHNQYLENPVKWLQHLDYQEKSGNQPDIELSKAKELLNDLLEKNVEIEVSPNGVNFFERGTKLKFEQLSDGYKSVLVWMCDLLSRLSTKQPEVEQISDFHGIVLVDEIGMFLHPKWQRTIVKKLRTTFPNIQFFFTTHSPIVLLGASEDAVFYKVYKEDGETKVADPIENKSLGHLMANGIITAPFLFGLESARNEVGNYDGSILDTSEDYLTGKIHAAVSKKIAQKNNISEDEIMDLIQKELEKYEAQTND